MPTKLKRFTIQLDDEIAEKLKALAEADGRPVAGFLSHLVKTTISPAKSAPVQMPEVGHGITSQKPSARKRSA